MDQPQQQRLPAKKQRAQLYVAMLRALGCSVDGARVLDFGCGSGGLVAGYASLGLDARGCDIRMRDDELARRLHGEDLIRPMEPPQFRIPFEDDSFDLVTSDQVFEHVHDYDQALAEITRVLRPGGASLHLFPSRYILIEPHQYVPLGSVIRNRAWLRLWATLGVRNPHQRGLSVDEIVDRSERFLRERTNYLPRRRIAEHFRRAFGRVEFVEAEFLRHSRRAKVLHDVARIPPFGFIPALYGTFKGRAVFAAGPVKARAAHDAAGHETGPQAASLS